MHKRKHYIVEVNGDETLSFYGLHFDSMSIGEHETAVDKGAVVWATNIDLRIGAPLSVIAEHYGLSHKFDYKGGKLVAMKMLAFAAANRHDLASSAIVNTFFDNALKEIAEVVNA